MKPHIGIDGFGKIGRHAELKSLANYKFSWNRGLHNFSLLSPSLLGGKKLFEEGLKVYNLTPVIQRYDLYFYLHSISCRSPPSVLVFLYQKPKWRLEHEKDQFTGLLPVLSL